MKLINTEEVRPEGKLTQKALDNTWDAFLGGGTSHSANAVYLTHIINRCEAEGIPYCLNAAPGNGYHIMPLKETDCRWRGI